MKEFEKSEKEKTRGLLRPLMSEDEVKGIHRASLDILENGIQVKNEAALDIFYSHGCRVDKKSGIVKIPSHVVESAIQSAPNEFLCAGRKQVKDAVINDDHTYFGVMSGAVSYLDPSSQAYRLPTKSDLANCIKLIDALDEITIANRVLVPSDVNVDVLSLHQLDAALSNTTKHVMCGSGSKKVIKASSEMAAVVAGGQKALRNRPLISGMASPISPLTLADDCCDTIIESVKAGLPVVIAVSVIGGASGPVTMAGLLIVHNTDILMGAVLAQLTEKGAPVLYSNYSGLLDMKSGLMPYGSPSLALMDMAAAQMAGFYGIPLYGAGLAGDSHLPDYQAALEASITGISAGLAGAHIVTGAGITSGIMVFSPAKLLCDSQLIKMIRAITAGIEITEERMATELIKTIGPGGDYLASDHTLKFFKEQTSYNLIDHSPFEAWQEKGSKDMIRRASEKAVQIMEDHHPEPLDPKVELELKKIIESTEKDIGARPPK